MTAPAELPVVKNGRARKWRRALGVLGGVVLIVLGAGWWFYGRDEAPPDDADMQISIPRVPDEENGMVQLGKLDAKPLDFYAFAEARGLDEMAAGNIFVGLNRNDTVMDAFLTTVAPEMKQVDAILALPHFEVSGNGSFQAQAMGTTFPEIGSALDVSHVLSLRATRRAQTGDYAGATDDVLRLRHLAQRFSEGHLLLIHLLTFFAINGIANSGCVELLNDKGLPAGELARLSGAWNTETPWAEIYQRSMMREYQHISSALGVVKAGDLYHATEFVNRKLGMLPGGHPREETVRDKLLLSWVFHTLQPNATRRLILEVVRPAKHLLDGTYTSRPQLPSMPRLSVLSLAMPNLAGREFASALDPTLGSVAKTGFVNEAQDRLVRAGLALRQYYNDHQELPPSLDALVPQYLAAEPMDPFDGKPLRYDQSRALVYSVGTDLSDHHGSQYVNVPPEKLYGESSFGDDKQPTLELKFAQKPVK